MLTNSNAIKKNERAAFIIQKKKALNTYNSTRKIWRQASYVQLTKEIRSQIDFLHVWYQHLDHMLESRLRSFWIHPRTHLHVKKSELIEHQHSDVSIVLWDFGSIFTCVAAAPLGSHFYSGWKNRIYIKHNSSQRTDEKEGEEEFPP